MFTSTEKKTPHLTRASNKKSFFLDEERQVLIFATDQILEFVVQSKSMLSDGTFKAAVPPYILIHILFGATSEWKMPGVWSFLGAKTKEIYKFLIF